MKMFAKTAALLTILILILVTAGYIMEQKKEYKIDENLKGKVNLIVVEKSKRQLALYHNNELKALRHLEI